MISLIGVTAVWGSTFFMIKGLLNEISALDFLSVRFILASVVSVIVMFPRLRGAKRQTWIHGLTLGLIYAMAQIFQTIGLQYTDASVSGFITGMYVVLTPIALLILFKARISPRAWGTVILATIGVAVLSLTGLTVGAGEFITLIGSAFYAVHIAFLGQWAKDDDPLALGVIQIFGIAVFCTLGALPGGISLPQSGGSWLALAFMSLIAGLGGAFNPNLGTVKDLCDQRGNHHDYRARICFPLRDFVWRGELDTSTRNRGWPDCLSNVTGRTITPHKVGFSLKKPHCIPVYKFPTAIFLKEEK
ncbi:DMT family transporter [Trueperella pyogenes]|uniref:DMT family transporter n=1 Tax=Trueperella pyogenes TaxID=1661 RepID=UPI003DA8CF5E